METSFACIFRASSGNVLDLSVLPMEKWGVQRGDVRFSTVWEVKEDFFMAAEPTFREVLRVTHRDLLNEFLTSLHPGLNADRSSDCHRGDLGVKALEMVSLLELGDRYQSPIVGESCVRLSALEIANRTLKGLTGEYVDDLFNQYVKC